MYTSWMDYVSIRPVTAGLVSLSLMLGACDMPQDGSQGQAVQTAAAAPNMTPAEQDLRAKTEKQRQTDSAIAGAVAGAVGGAVLGYLIGGWQGAAIGAGSGAVLGGALGYGYGSYMNAKAQKYSNDQARYAAVAKGANDTVAYYDQVNATARTILAEQQAKVAKLNQDYRAGTITKEQYRRELASAGPDQANLNEQIQGLDKQMAAMRADPQASNLTQQVQQLQAQRDALKSTIDQLVQLYGTVPSEVQQSSPIVVSKK